MCQVGRSLYIMVVEAERLLQQVVSLSPGGFDSRLSPEYRWEHLD